MTYAQIVEREEFFSSLIPMYYKGIKSTAGTLRDVYRMAVELCSVEGIILHRMATHALDEEDRIMAMCEAYDAAMRDRDEYPVQYFSL